MTDAEIIKNLENLTNVKIKFGKRRITVVEIDLLEDALALILRQQKQFQLIANFLKERKDEAKQKSIDTGDKYYRGYMWGVDFAEQLIKEKDEWKRE